MKGPATGLGDGVGERGEGELKLWLSETLGVAHDRVAEPKVSQEPVEVKKE